jgi:hypothetical protein
MRRVDDHEGQGLSGEWVGGPRAGRRLSRALSRVGTAGARRRRRAAVPASAGRWLLAVTRDSGTASRSVRVTRPTVPTILSPRKYAV